MQEVTTLHKGVRLLKKKNSTTCLNFATLSVAEKNAERLTRKLGQKILPIEVNGVYFLMAENYI